MRKTATTLFLLLFLLVEYSGAQFRNTTYQDLVLRSEQSTIYVDYLSLPGSDDGSLFAVSFRMGYELLPFRRIRSDESRPGPEFEYTTLARMNLEIFSGSSNSRRQDFDPVARESWVDTAWAVTYEETRSRNDHLQGMMTTNLAPGDYSLMLQLNRGETINESRSRERNFTVPDFRDTDEAVIAVINTFTDQDNSASVQLYNFGENVLYGQNYQVMVLLPDHTPERDYDIHVYKLEPGTDPDIEGDPLFTQRFTSGELIYTNGFSADSESSLPVISFEKSDTGYPLLISEVPNRNFPNSRFRITVSPAGSDSLLAEKDVSSSWVDMPVSLLNLDVSINMLRFITEEDQLREINRGSMNDRERKFRQFWAERDPTPDTEYNELMTEYYRRIDYSYENFTTPERPGYESDQGLAYIRMGPPNSTDRTYPTDGPTREIWIYDNRTLIFEATSGFGDFRLVGSE